MTQHCPELQDNSQLTMMLRRSTIYALLTGLIFTVSLVNTSADPIEIDGQPVVLTISEASDHTLRITLQKHNPRQGDIPVDSGRVLAPSLETESIQHIKDLDKKQTLEAGSLQVQVHPNPLQVSIRTNDGTLVQRLQFNETTGNINFELGEGPIFGMGNGGQYFDRRGSFYTMQRGHRRGEFHIFGARTPIPFLIGTEGWSLFVHRPYNAHFDLRENPGQLIPKKDPENSKEASFPLDVFVTHIDKPSRALSEYTKLTGKPPMPPKWSLGYMQSHRNLSGPEEVLQIARTFREKQLPADALIYLGTGFTPNGWNTGHGSFTFNPGTFDEPQAMIDSLHDMNYKISLHLTSPPNNLHGRIPPRNGARVDESHVYSYWQEHLDVFDMGIDGWWPDMGDGLDNDSRLNRHYLYYEGPLHERPDERPWSLHRTGYAGMQRFGGWIWSGDVRSS
jgi:alpha-glucosidase/alpha-D-xyloside xylohydrolase